MSYDIALRPPGTPCQTCGSFPGEPVCPDPTYNLTEIFHYALTREPMPSAEVSECEAVLFGKAVDSPRGLRVLNGLTGRATVTTLALALALLRDPKHRLVLTSLEPANGWGTLRGATEVIETLLESAIDYPLNTWEIH